MNKGYPPTALYVNPWGPWLATTTQAMRVDGCTVFEPMKTTFWMKIALVDKTGSINFKGIPILEG